MYSSNVTQSESKRAIIRRRVLKLQSRGGSSRDLAFELQTSRTWAKVQWKEGLKEAREIERSGGDPTRDRGPDSPAPTDTPTA